MKKLLSLLMAFSLALVPMLSFADESSGATQNIYNMLLEELTAANLSMTPYDDINRIYLGYMLEKNALGNAVVIFDAHSDGFTIGVGYGKPIDAAGDFPLQRHQLRCLCRQDGGQSVQRRVASVVRNLCVGESG